jgi:hypothetical protein
MIDGNNASNTTSIILNMNATIPKATIIGGEIEFEQDA